MNQGELTFGQHLQELRKRLLYSIIAVIAGTAIAFPFWEKVVVWLKRPAQALNNGEGVPLIATQVTEAFTTSFRVSILAGLILAFPIVLYQVIRFVAPGLTSKEQRYLLAFLPAVLLVFLAGVAFGYLVLTPQALPFLLSFGGEVVQPQIRVSSYVDVMVRLLFWMGIVFETPLIMLLLTRIGIANARRFSRFRRYWIVVAFVLGAVITPTVDPVNQALVAIPLLVLYEVGIVLVRVLGRKESRTP
tara:strand:- start:590 stop:1327 length:738 start_codon:yes stop_codon:yes gene_type:complete